MIQIKKQIVNLQKNNEVCSAIKEANIEIVSHGYRWIDYQFVDEKIEKEHILTSTSSIS